MDLKKINHAYEVLKTHFHIHTMRLQVKGRKKILHSNTNDQSELSVYTGGPQLRMVDLIFFFYFYESHMHSLKTVLQILNFDLYSG